MPMQAQNTRQVLVRDSGIIFLIRFFPTLANVLVILYFSRQLSLEAYGAYQHIWAQYYVLAAVAIVGLPAFVMTVGPQALFGMIRQWQPGKRWLLIAWPALWAISFALLQLVGGILPFWLAFGFLITGVAGMVQEGLLTAAKKFGAVLWINIAYTLVFLYLHYFFLKGNFDLIGLFIYLLILAAGRLLLLLYALLPVWKLRHQESPNTVSGMDRLWLHLGLYEFSQMVFRWADKFVVSLFLSAGAMALYFNGAMELPFLPILLGAAGSALLLQMHHSSAVTTTQGKAEMVRLSAVALSSIVLPLFFFLLFFAAPLFSLALSEKYLAALPVFWMMLLLLPLRAFNFTTLLQHLHKGALINYGALLDIVLALSLMYPLYQLLGLPGIALSLVIGTYAQAAFYTFYIQKLTGLRLHQIIPLQNWLIKGVLLLFLFAGARYGAFVLQLSYEGLLTALILLLLVSGIMLLQDFKRMKKAKSLATLK